MPFDITTLSEEARAYIDQQRTQASKTAYENAMKKLETDEEFINGIRSKIEEETRLSAEEKLKLERAKIEEERKKLQVDTNMFQSKNYLMSNGLPEDHVNNFLGFLVSEDSEKTKSNLETFVTSYKSTLDSQVNKIKDDLLHGIHKPNMGGGDGNVGDTERLRKDFDNARKMGNQVEMARISRLASELKIQL